MNIPYKKDFKSAQEYRIERDRTICTMYSNDVPLTHIARQMHVGDNTVRQTLKENNIYEPDKNSRTRARRNEIIYQLYQQGLSSVAIAKQLEIGKTTVRDVLVKHFHVPTYGTDAKHKWRKHSVNKLFFHVIDTEEKAYWLGFLYADGCITNDAIRLELAAADHSHLEQFKKALQAETYPLYYRKNVNSYACVINSKDIVNDLVTTGCVQHKTHILRFPNENTVPDHLLNHFMRGYFDGDGCVHIDKKNYSFSIVGTLGFVQEYQQHLMRGINKSTTVKLKNTASSDIVEFRLGGRQQIIRIYNFLYKDATIFLNRKKDKFMQLVNN